ncbi:hypothetical protein FGB62_40g012 [Gracilaria domingensis]|nr:hypothetical protein FGB62_40g012 [Gracilaria domingensis]
MMRAAASRSRFMWRFAMQCEKRMHATRVERDAVCCPRVARTRGACAARARRAQLLQRTGSAQAAGFLLIRTHCATLAPSAPSIKEAHRLPSPPAWERRHTPHRSRDHSNTASLTTSNARQSRQRTAVMGDEIVHQLKRESQRLLLQHGNRARKIIKNAQNERLSPGIRRGMSFVDQGLRKGIRSAEERFDTRAQPNNNRGPSAALRKLQQRVLPRSNARSRDAHRHRESRYSRADMERDDGRRRSTRQRETRSSSRHRRYSDEYDNDGDHAYDTRHRSRSTRKDRHRSSRNQRRRSSRRYRTPSPSPSPSPSPPRRRRTSPAARRPSSSRRHASPPRGRRTPPSTRYTPPPPGYPSPPSGGSGSSGPRLSYNGVPPPPPPQRRPSIRAFLMEKMQDPRVQAKVGQGVMDIQDHIIRAMARDRDMDMNRDRDRRY